jgi:hypothetical protein
MDSSGVLCTAVGVSGSGGSGGGATGSVTGAGTNGTLAQAVQGITGGVPVGVSGTIAATQSGAWSFGLSGPIPAGSNVIGAVTQSGAPWAVSGTVAATQSGGWSVGLATGTNAIGTVAVTALPAIPTGTNAIGSVLADVRVGGAANASGNPIFAQITNFPTTQPVSGTVNAVQSGAYTVIQGAAGVAAWKVDGSAVTQPVSGSVTANLGTLNGAATAGNQATMIANQAATTGSATGGAAATASSLIGGVYNSTAPTLTNGQQAAFQFDANGQLKVASAGGGAATGGSVTAPGITGTTAQAIQGIVGGVPQATTIRAAGTNRSTTVGTTAVTLMPANAVRQGWKIKNDTTSDIWINFDATATAAPGSGNIRIPAGGYLSSEPGYVETGAMSAIGAASGLAITAREH